MFKNIAFMPRRADFTRQAFQAYYESRHTPLALTMIRNFAKYTRNHVVEAQPDTPFDTLSEFWFDDVQEAMAIGAFMQSDASLALREDEAQFLDRPAIRAFPVEETVLTGPERIVEPFPRPLYGLIFDAVGDADAQLATLRQLGMDWAQVNRLRRVCLNVALQIPGVPAAPCHAIMLGWPDSSAPAPTAPSLPSMATVGLRHRVILSCIETASERLRD
jgi:uncharacterized protein (TIGR02118 family)